MKPTYGSQYHCTACRTTKQTPMFSCHTLVDSIPSFSSGPFCLGKLSGKKTSKSMFVIFTDVIWRENLYLHCLFASLCKYNNDVYTWQKVMFSLRSTDGKKKRQRTVPSAPLYRQIPLSAKSPKWTNLWLLLTSWFGLHAKDIRSLKPPSLKP